MGVQTQPWICYQMLSPSFFPHDLFCQSPNCLINNLHSTNISYHTMFGSSYLQMAKIRPRQMPESTTILQNIVIPAVCSHISCCLIRFDNQEMTAVLTLLSFWQTCFSEAVWRWWLRGKLENLLWFFGGYNKSICGCLSSCPKSHSVDWKPVSVLMFGLSGSNMAAVWLQGFPLWCGCEGTCCEKKLVKRPTNTHQYAKISCLSVGCIHIDICIS